jgi:ADP-ribose pyrophosphatase YjhB (NUDIX family)
MMLLELPTADEIDDLACTTPEFQVRKFEYDRRSSKADLDHMPCKGQMILVVRGEKGIIFVRESASGGWVLPSGLILTTETAAQCAKRVAKAVCGIGLRSLELAAMYDVIWHHSDYTVKRLHLVYACATDESECTSGGSGRSTEGAFFTEPPEADIQDEIVRNALIDCSDK